MMCSIRDAGFSLVPGTKQETRAASSIETDEAANTNVLRLSLRLPQSQIAQDKQHYDDDADDIKNISRHD